MRALARLVTLAAMEDLLLATPVNERIHRARGILLGAAGFPSPFANGGAPRASQRWRRRQRWKTPGVTRGALAPRSAGPHRVAASPRSSGEPPGPRDCWRRPASSRPPASAPGSRPPCWKPCRRTPDRRRRSGTLAASHDGPGIGEDRALDMVASSLIPFALAFAAHSGDEDLADAASRQWERLPASAAERRHAGARRDRLPDRHPGQDRCPWGAGPSPPGHNIVPTATLLRMPDRRRGARCQSLIRFQSQTGLPPVSCHQITRLLTSPMTVAPWLALHLPREPLAFLLTFS